MAVSALTIQTPNFHSLQTFNPTKSFFTTTTKPTSSCSCFSNTDNAKLSTVTASTSATKKRVFEMGIGLLAASVMALSPLDANATRVEYYATVEEPSCELNFARSGLGYCDILVGSGEEVPYSQLIDMHYTARFADGTVFDSSYKRGRPLTMRLGVGKVTKGLDQGILGGEGVPPMREENVSFRFPLNWHMGQNQQDAFQVTAIYQPMQLFCMILISLISTLEIELKEAQSNNRWEAHEDQAWFSNFRVLKCIFIFLVWTKIVWKNPWLTVVTPLKGQEVPIPA